MKKFTYFLGIAASIILAACSMTPAFYEVTDAPVMSAYYSDWDRAVRADVDMQNMYIGTPSQITKPIDMYMAMALALKYNYTRRLASYRENLLKSNINPTALPTMVESLGYDNTTNSKAVPVDLKVSWNLLDLSASYYQNGLEASEIAAEEMNRKVINNILQEARSTYWKALAAQKLLPVIDDMSEYLVRIVDEINACLNDETKVSESPTNLLLKKRKYLESIRQLTELRRKFETAPAEFAGLLGLHPSTQIKLAGSEYGNFSIPSMRVKVQQLEWLALTNRPELRAFDAVISKDELELVIKESETVENSDYRQDPGYYNRKWAKDSQDLSMTVFEEIRSEGESTYNSLARQRMSHIILNQVHLSWALYQSAVEDYYLNMGVATASEDIAEDFTSREGANKTISQLESARAIIDEATAFLSYIDVQEAIGRLYATIGMDAIPTDMLSESPSALAVQIRETLDKWKEGIFINTPGKGGVTLSSKKPPVDISSAQLMPNVVVGNGSDVRIQIPDEIFKKVNWNGEYKTVAGSLDEVGLPRWLKYDDKTHTFTGHPSLDDVGSHKIKVYAMDKAGNSAVLSFILTVENMFVQTMEYKGLTGYRRAQVFHKCAPGTVCVNNGL